MAPAETVLAETVPAETVPAETVPAETVPAETVPAETVPAETGSALGAGVPSCGRSPGPRGIARTARTASLGSGQYSSACQDGDPGQAAVPGDAGGSLAG